MRKLDNYGTFFVSGLGISGAVSLAIVALTLDVLFALRAFIFIFAVTMAVAVALIVFSQGEIREVEQDLRKNNVMRDSLALVAQAKGLGVTHSNNAETARADVANALSSEYTKLAGAGGLTYPGLETPTLDN